MQPLAVPQQKWPSVSMDFITKLLLTARGHIGAIVFMDQLAKMVRITPLKPDFLASGVVDLLISQIF